MSNNQASHTLTPSEYRMGAIKSAEFKINWHYTCAQDRNNAYGHHGPWFVRRDPNGTGVEVTNNPYCQYGQSKVCVMGDGAQGDALANAVLISAAPKMFASIANSDRALGKWLSAALDDPHQCDEFKQEIRAWLENNDEIITYVRSRLHAIMYGTRGELDQFPELSPRAALSQAKGG
jgi:hypothetical protein